MTDTATPDTSSANATRKIAVVMPIPNDPDWTIFEELSEEIPIIVCDDSDGKLSPPPRENVHYYDYAAQREVMGEHWDAIPHKSAACRNFGHYLAWQQGYDVIIALDYDCRTRKGWLEEHLECLATHTDAPAVQGHWINSVEQPGFWARGYPYELRNPEASAVTETTVSGTVKLNMGVWDNILDLNGIDKLETPPPYDPGLRGDRNYIALGNIPVCGMNTAFTGDLTPAYFFLPDVLVNGWQLSRHDDIWGGYVVKKLMDKRGDLFSYGRPVVEHTRQTKLEKVVVIEHYMHLMSMGFYDMIDAAVERVPTGEYNVMFATLVEEYLSEVGRSKLPLHYVGAYRELGDWMQRWAACFT